MTKMMLKSASLLPTRRILIYAIHDSSAGDRVVDRSGHGGDRCVKEGAKLLQTYQQKLSGQAIGLSHVFYT